MTVSWCAGPATSCMSVCPPILGVFAAVSREVPRCGQKCCEPCKYANLRRVQVAAGDGSLQPVAVGAAVEVTNPST